MAKNQRGVRVEGLFTPINE